MPYLNLKLRSLSSIISMCFLFASYFDSDYPKENYYYTFFIPIRRNLHVIKTYKARTLGLERSLNEYRGRLKKYI